MKLFTQASAAIVLVTLAVGCTPANKNNMNSSSKTSSIIGGTEVPEGAALQKSIVGIYDMKKGALCTGSLLENNIVLTAAHCIGAAAEDLLIVFSTDLPGVFQSQDKNLILQKLRRGVKTVVNPNWGKTSQVPNAATGDTALIKFAGPVPAGFKPATLLNSAEVLTEGLTITVAGYGVSKDVLTEVNKDEIPDFQEKVLKGEIFCETSKAGEIGKCYKEEASGEGYLRTTELQVAGDFNDTEIVFDQQHGQAACEGDSGGPAYVKQANGEYHLFGVTSRGTLGCDGFIVYSNITSKKLSAWLTYAMEQLK
ncbi:MAG TPA: trypsin-like serine protease [Pseudobdellovibrionaceae bacterium]|jgi:secreted trypsin-like serine protease